MNRRAGALHHSLMRRGYDRGAETSMRVLIVEDHERMADLLRRGLTEEGYAVDVVSTADDGAWMAEENDYDAIVLDVVLPDGDGFDVCRRIRHRGRWAPIIMLTARDAVEDRVHGLDAGADDYLVKPFSFDELLARVRALVRRRPVERRTVLTFDDLVLDPAERRAERAGTPLRLTAKEFALLEYFLRHRGELLTRATLIEHVWDFAFEADSNVVDVHVSALRQKIDRPFGTDSIETVRGAGYRLRGRR
jgi:two-component system, OmpR family, response regulator